MTDRLKRFATDAQGCIRALTLRTAHVPAHVLTNFTALAELRGSTDRSILFTLDAAALVPAEYAALQHARLA
jgi:hypothetical protein